MRISNNTMIDRALRDINANKVRVANTERDISTGVRIHRGSDDPTGAARANVLRKSMSENQTFADNVDSSRQFLTQTDAAMTQLNDAMLRVRSIALSGASGHLQQSDKNVLADEVSQLREAIRAIGNTQSADGRYLFGGLKTQTEPFPALDVTLGPNDVGTMAVEIAPGSMMTYNVTGVQVFGDTTPPDDTNLFASLDELEGFLRAGTNNRDITDISLAKIDAHMDGLNALRTNVGTRVQRLDLAAVRYQDLALTLDGLLQDTEATNIPTASLHLNQYDAALKASLAVGARALPLSLVDFLR